MIQSQTVTPPFAAMEGTTLRLNTATTNNSTRSQRPRTRFRWGWFEPVDKSFPFSLMPTRSKSTADHDAHRAICTEDNSRFLNSEDRQANCSDLLARNVRTFLTARLVSRNHRAALLLGFCQRGCNVSKSRQVL